MPIIQMPVEQIPEPKDEEILWRYLDLSRFLSMLSTNTLYFCRANLFEDTWDSAYPADVVEAGLSQLVPLGVDPDKYKVGMSVQRNIGYVNCWHKNRHESAAMWKLYSQSKESIAIKTSVKSLKRALSRSTQELIIGDVTYAEYTAVDPYWSQWISNLFVPIYGKRLSFAHEQEVRISLLSHNDPTESGFKFSKQLPGVSVAVDLSILFGNVYVSPSSPAWFRDVVIDVMKKYGLTGIEVIRSPLYEGPVQ